MNISRFKKFITEATAVPGKMQTNHLEHVEDEIINHGSEGAGAIIDMLRGIVDEMSGSQEASGPVSVKFDGAPALICGIHPGTHKFFVGTKGVFAGKDPKICYDKDDVRGWYAGDLAEKLIMALTYLPSLNIKGVIKGDFMFAKGTPGFSEAEMEGEDCYVFRPNTISYAVPTNSKMGKEIEKAQIGIVWHTKIVTEGDKLEDNSEPIGDEINNIGKNQRVWWIGADHRDETGTTKLSVDENQRALGYLAKAEGSLRKSGDVLNQLSATMGKDTHALGPRLKVYFNSRVRNNNKFVDVAAMAKEFEEYYINAVNAEKDKRSTAAGQAKYNTLADEGQKFFDSNRNEIYMAIATYCSIHNAKNILINKLNKIDSVKSFLEYAPGKYKVTAPEGFVVIRNGKALKLVDRFVFSANNFNMEKNWG